MLWARLLAYVTGTVSTNVISGTHTSSINGTYTSSGTCTAGMSGSFSFGQVPSITSTQWSGTISGASTTTFTASLTEDKDANLTGTVQFAGTVCPNPITVAGSVNGEQVYFNDGLGGQIQVSGTITGTANGAKNIEGNASGPCASGGGNMTMTRP